MDKKEINMKKGYKVVTKRTLMSYLDFTLGSVKYKIHKWAKPIKGNGPLCVFNTIEDAEIFNHQMLASIYECFYEESELKTVYYHTAYNEIRRTTLGNLPKGTLLATKVQLIRGVR